MTPQFRQLRVSLVMDESWAAHLSDNALQMSFTSTLPAKQKTINDVCMYALFIVIYIERARIMLIEQAKI